MMTKQALATPSFNTRTFAALEKITKEHWRRQMLEEERQMLEGERQREMVWERANNVYKGTTSCICITGTTNSRRKEKLKI